MASLSAKEDGVSINEEVFDYRVDMQSILRLSSADPTKGGLSTLRCVAFPKGNTAKIAPGHYLVNASCKLEPVAIALPAVASFKDEGRLDELAIAWEIATNGKLYLITVPLPLRNGKTWVTDSADSKTNKLSMVSTLSTPADRPGVKMLKTIDEWLKAGQCVRLKNVGVTSLKEAKTWCISNSFTKNVQQVIFNARHSARKVIAREADRVDGKMKKPDKSDKAKELTAEEKLKMDERVAKVDLVAGYLKTIEKYYNAKLVDRIICVELPALPDGDDLSSPMSSEALELVRAQCSAKQHEILDEMLMNAQLDKLIQVGRLGELGPFTPMSKIEPVAPVGEGGGAAGPSGAEPTPVTSTSKNLFGDDDDDAELVVVTGQAAKNAQEALAQAQAQAKQKAKARVEISSDEEVDEEVISTQVEEQYLGKRARKDIHRFTHDASKPTTIQPSKKAEKQANKKGRGPNGESMVYKSRGAMLAGFEIDSHARTHTHTHTHTHTQTQTYTHTGVAEKPADAEARKERERVPSAKVLADKIKTLEDQIAIMTSKHATELMLKEVNIKLEMQPKIKEAYDNGYADCKKAMEDARSFMRAFA
jgi:hypothetical protein